MQKTELEKMLAGELYDSSDADLVKMRKDARALMHMYNQTLYDTQHREILLRKILGKMGANIDIQTPFFVDYGTYIEIGNNFYAN